MRWIWIDRFVDFQSGRRASAIKNVTLAEEHLHDHFPGFPVMPECLMIEAMAQTAGILVGEARAFQEKVILAKVKKAVFFHYVCPGDSLRIDAEIETITPEAASTRGTLSRASETIAEIELLFSHVDQNLGGTEFPQQNFVFEDNTFKSLLRSFLAERPTDPNAEDPRSPLEPSA